MSADMPEYPEAVLGIVAVDSPDPDRLASFYGELLGRRVVARGGAYVNLEWEPRFGAGLIFQKVAEPTPGKNRIHMDILCTDYEATAKRAEELGATRAEGYPTERIAVMCDPDGNVFCLVPPPSGG